jgi:hypothetical protein
MVNFGSLAIMVTFVTVDPWFCVAGFHRVCAIGFSIFILHQTPLIVPFIFAITLCSLESSAKCYCALILPTLSNISEVIWECTFPEITAADTE